MELLIAVLIAFGVVNSTDASKLNASSVDQLIKENSITQKDINDKASIIGLEESDM